MRYVILYRDGAIGYPRRWGATLDQIEKVIRKFPHQLRPIAVVTEYDYNRALTKLADGRR